MLDSFLFDSAFFDGSASTATYISVSDSGVCVGVYSSLVGYIPVVDISTSSTDISQLIAAILLIDTIVSQEAAYQLTVTLTKLDTLLGADAITTVGLVYTFSDSATASDAYSALTALLSNVDAVIGTDGKTISVTIEINDLTTALDSMSILGTYTGIDDGVGIEDPVTQGITLPPDSGSGDDSYDLYGLISKVDVTSSLETLSVLATLVQLEEALGVDIKSVSYLVSKTDLGVTTDIASINAAINAYDSAGLTDYASVIGFIGAVESLVGVDARSTFIVSIPTTDSGALLDTVSVTVYITPADLATLLDSKTLTVAISKVDSVIGTDALTIIGIPLSDSGGTVDSPSTIFAMVPQTDTGLYAEVIAAFARTMRDSGSFTDYLVSIIWGGVADKKDNDVTIGTDLLLSLLAYISKSDTPVSVDTSDVAAYIGTTDQLISVDGSSLFTNIPVTDTGTMVDILGLLGQYKYLYLTEAGSLVDISSIIALLPKFDILAGNDSMNILAQIAKADVGVLHELLKSIQLIGMTFKTLTDSGASAESSYIGLSSLDAGTFLDVLSGLAVTLTKIDALVGIDALATLVAALLVTDSNLTFVEVHTFASNLITMIDSGVGTESRDITAYLTLLDTGALVDLLYYLLGIIQVSDLAGDVESSSLVYAFTSSESALGADISAIRASLYPTDLGSLLEALEELVGAHLYTDAGTGADLLSDLRYIHELVDSGLSVDILSGMLADILPTDIGVTGEITIILASLGYTDSGVLADSSATLIKGVLIKTIIAIVRQANVITSMIRSPYKIVSHIESTNAIIRKR